jgi:hypothetical protein
MAHKLRIQYPGAIYRVMNRGDRREATGLWAGSSFGRSCWSRWKTRPGPSHFGQAVQEAEGADAERLVREALKPIGWSEADRQARRKGEPGKVELVWQLRGRTTMPLAWIAERLKMGTRGHLAWLLQRHGQPAQFVPTGQGLLQI